RRSTAHRAIDRRRRQARRPWVDPAADPAALPATDDGSDPLLCRALDALLDSLPANARAVVVLRFQEDLDPEDIAAALAMPVNTVKSHLRRSLHWLRERLPESAP
ncbi:MAG: sigma-70 family RNA polymerase sigma factor, partial [Variovorax sp.]